MSRTIRTHMEYKTCSSGKNSQGFNFGYSGHYFLDRNSRDKKPWDKPPKWFKRMKRQIERSNVNTAMRSGKDIPVFPKNDQWEWS